MTISRWAWPCPRSTNLSFYVDDVITEAPTVQQTQKQKEKATKIFSDAQFTLHKWKLNAAELEQPAELHHNEEQSFAKEQLGTKTTKTTLLGLPWDPNADMLSVCFPQKRRNNQEGRPLLFSQNIWPTGASIIHDASRQVCIQSHVWNKATLGHVSLSRVREELEEVVYRSSGTRECEAHNCTIQRSNWFYPTPRLRRCKLKRGLHGGLRGCQPRVRNLSGAHHF